MPITENEKMVFLKRGKEVEQEFARLFNDVTETTKLEDIDGHIDMKISVGIDVKGLKKVRRHDSEANENIHWVEIKSVQGKAGWLYGDALFFSFELKDYWIVVSKKDLQEFIAEKCKEKIKTEKPDFYKLYQREGRKDIITLVSSYDLCYISTTMISKN